MKWGSTAASGSGLHAFQPSMSLEVGSRKVHAHFFLNAPSGAGCLPTALARCIATVGSVSMHLLVPGAYRLGRSYEVCPARKPVSMHLLVPGAYRPFNRGDQECAVGQSQCTFWCRVLTDTVNSYGGIANPTSLNAPSGAGCLPTTQRGSLAYGSHVSQCTFWCRVLTPPRLRLRHRLPRVSMHLLMPGAYRPMPGEPSPGPRQSQYTVWCWVLIDRKGGPVTGPTVHLASQYTVWCWVLIDTPVRVTAKSGKLKSQYTVWCWVLIDGWGARDPDYPLLTSLNTPCGAGCLSTCVAGRADGDGDRVSIHRVVLGAYRLKMNLRKFAVVLVSIHRVVLGAYRQKGGAL